MPTHPVKSESTTLHHPEIDDTQERRLNIGNMQQQYVPQNKLTHNYQLLNQYIRLARTQQYVYYRAGLHREISTVIDYNVNNDLQIDT